MCDGKSTNVKMSAKQIRGRSLIEKGRELVRSCKVREGCKLLRIGNELLRQSSMETPATFGRTSGKPSGKVPEEIKEDVKDDVKDENDVKEDVKILSDKTIIRSTCYSIHHQKKCPPVKKL